MIKVHPIVEDLTIKIQRRYNAEHDQGPVTWAIEDLRYAMLEFAKEVDREIETLYQRINELEERTHD